jgi:hypothetical protein
MRHKKNRPEGRLKKTAISGDIGVFARACNGKKSHKTVHPARICGKKHRAVLTCGQHGLPPLSDTL